VTSSAHFGVVSKAAVQAAATKKQGDQDIVAKMKELEDKLAKKAKAQAAMSSNGHLLVNGPLPSDFNERFSQAVAKATGSDARQVKVTQSTAIEGSPDIVEVAFVASPKVVHNVETQASNPDSQLAKGTLHSFLVAKGDDEEKPKKKIPVVEEEEESEATPVQEKGIDIDTAMPYGDLEPFGREDTAQELTESSVKESDEMVDQLERAEVAEEKRAVFRALTRLRGAAITSFDGVARSQTGNIDEYNKIHKWRKSHPLHHLADEESDINKWAFPDNADF
jgi:NADH dehydrogenase/NADH:ubiquinone oxidoreductase subunit G